MCTISQQFLHHVRSDQRCKRKSFGKIYLLISSANDLVYSGCLFGTIDPSLHLYIVDLMIDMSFTSMNDSLCVNEFFTKNPVSISWSDTHLVFSHTKIILCQPGAGLRSRLNIILMTGTTIFFVQHHLGPRPSPHFGHQQSWMKNNYSFYKVKDNHISKFNSFFKSLLHTIYSIQPPVKLVK